MGDLGDSCKCAYIFFFQYVYRNDNDMHLQTFVSTLFVKFNIVQIYQSLIEKKAF